jgi:hypothetical protein
MPQTFQNLLGIKGCPLTELFHCAQTGRQWEHANTQVTNGAPLLLSQTQSASWSAILLWLAICKDPQSMSCSA